MRIHNWDKKYHAAIRQVKKAAVSRENKEMILDFADELMNILMKDEEVQEVLKRKLMGRKFEWVKI